MNIYLAVFIGSGLGGLLRYWFSGIFDAWGGGVFPWGTLFVNVAGSFVISFLGTLIGPDSLWITSLEARQFVMVGVLGGFTTFSAFSFQTIEFLNNREWVWSVINIIGSISLCLLAAWLGQSLVLAWIKK